MSVETVVQIADDTSDVPDAGYDPSWLDGAANFIALETGEVTVRFVAPKEIQQLIREFHNKDVVPNVLAFPFDEPPGLDTGILGDIAICPDVVRQEATQFDVPVSARYAHMVVHGFLHLNGFDHLDEAQAREMESAESVIVTRCGFDDPWQGETDAHERDTVLARGEVR